ncbi:MAG: CopG family transcriptional regulator [Desulfobacteraceae bacterium 4572_19]|nr:MAG: CopG family transcriptional regulator [Desulfobacteraceae bacterium 4572_19]
MLAPDIRKYFPNSETVNKALRLKALETSCSMSKIINEALREALSEDAEDLAVFDERSSEPLVSYEQMVKRLKQDGRI